MFWLRHAFKADRLAEVGDSVRNLFNKGHALFMCLLGRA